ncbi:hypothetical protein JZ751_026530 [Albula glossodonta]|uniref:Mitochondrial glutathione transporter SLC25A39 n=1 Tax=Albula glossodonta TaxID=121402 RepID=A0A8T2PLR2_9TELE|nr:hypothetical protein JZ751_026530 [Albula glossodonta]
MTFMCVQGVRMGEREPSRGITPVQQMLASGTGALLTSLFVTPLDVVKIRLQAQRSPFCQVLYVRLSDAFVKITRYEGVRSLWSGLPPTLVMAVPATVIYFTCYDQLRDFLHYRMGYQGSQVPLVAGGLSRLGAVTVISPLELVRTKMQSRQLSYHELRVCIRSAVAQDGWLSLWRGWGPTVLRDVPFSALYWFNYELVKAKLCAGYSVAEATFMMSFVAGAISGAIAAVMTLPFDVVKTQRQIQLGEMDTLAELFSAPNPTVHCVTKTHPLLVSLPSFRQGATWRLWCFGLRGSGCSVVSTPPPTETAPAKKPSSTWHIMGRILAESGYRGLFTGLLPRVIKVAPACAVMISTYEFGKTFFQQLNRERALQGL